MEFFLLSRAKKNETILFTAYDVQELCSCLELFFITFRVVDYRLVRRRLYGLSG